ncbi:MAG: type II toxin-antitoxin system Phd/YefM family antitoxin [Flavobacteriaceae bacterium]|nr:type II toxin-antitoxin system Phd/YefM family antitoxin [Flavobacteriaceae bacterium]
MKTISSTLARQNFSDIIETVETEEITISKNNKNIAVIISCEKYEELVRIEDILHTKTAKLAIQEGLASEAEVKKIFSI